MSINYYYIYQYLAMTRDLESTHSSAGSFSQLSAAPSFLNKAKMTIYFHCKVAMSFPEGKFCLNNGKYDNSYLITFLLQIYSYAGTPSQVFQLLCNSCHVCLLKRRCPFNSMQTCSDKRKYFVNADIRLPVGLSCT